MRVWDGAKEMYSKYLRNKKEAEDRLNKITRKHR